MISTIEATSAPLRSRTLHFGPGALGGAVAVAAVIVGVGLAVAATWSEMLHVAVLLAVLAVLLLVTTGARRAMLAIAVMSLPFQFGINVAYREDAASLGALGGIEISVATVAIVALWLLWLADLLMGADVPAMRLSAALPFGTVVVVALAAAAFASDVVLAINELALLLEALLLFAYLRVWARQHTVRTFVLGCLLVSGAVQALLVIVGRFGGLPVGRVDPTLGSATIRSGGTIGSPNTAGTFFAVLLIVSFTLAIAPAHDKLRRLAMSSAPLALFALVLTSSRGAWIGTAVGLTVAGVGAWRLGWVDAVRLIACAAVVIAAAPIVAGPVIDRLTRDDDGAFEGRGPLVTMTVDVIAEHPMLGVGPNNLGPELLDHQLARDPRTWIYTVHNKYLLVWAELGLLGFIAFVGFLVWAVRRAITASRAVDPGVAAVGLGTGAALAALAVHMTVESFNSRPQTHLLVVLAALAAGASAVAPRTGMTEEANRHG